MTIHGYNEVRKSVFRKTLSGVYTAMGKIVYNVLLNIYIINDLEKLYNYVDFSDKMVYFL
jgi:hypothetical protein